MTHSHYQKNPDSADSKTAQKAELIAALGAALLALGKLLIFFLSGSLVVALSAWDSTIDALVSLINRTIIKFARLDADYNHPYGHGRAESIAALGQGALIMGGAIGIIASGSKQIYDVIWKQAALTSSVSWWQVIFFALVGIVSMTITKWLHHYGKKLNSTALLADAEHYRADVIVNIATGIAIALVVYTHRTILDPIIAIIFSLYILYSAFRLIMTGINELMDHDIPVNIKQDAIKIIEKTDKRIIDIHNFRGRKSGHRYFFDFHVTLPDELTFLELHSITENIEDALRNEFDGDVFIHTDPGSIRLKNAPH